MDHSQTGQIGAGSPSFGGVSSSSPSSVLLSDLLRYDISRLRPPISNSVAYPVELAAGPAMASSAPTLSWITRPAVRHHKHFKGKSGTHQEIIKHTSVKIKKIEDFLEFKKQSPFR